MRTDSGGEKGGRGNGGNQIEVHQVSKMLKKELLHYMGRYTLEFLKNFKVNSNSKIYNSKHSNQILAKSSIFKISKVKDQKSRKQFWNKTILKSRV